MQSSLWKLLTAAGIIGIGTMIVLEVQRRLPVSPGQVQPATAAGTETTVTPDDTTPLDQMLADAGGSSGPETFDDPDSGMGSPAPPEDNSRFFDPKLQEVRKSDLADDINIFAGDEPSETTEVKPVGFQSEVSGSAPPAAENAVAADQDSPQLVFPSEVTGDKPEPPNSDAAIASSFAGGESSPPAGKPVAAKGAVAAPVPKANSRTNGGTAGQSQSGVSGGKTASSKPNPMMFFPNGGKSDSPGTTAGSAESGPTAATQSSKSAVAPAAFPQESSGRSSKAPSATADNRVTRTSATVSADEPMIFLPDDEPAPVNGNGSAAGQDSPGFDPPSFEPDAPTERPADGEPFIPDGTVREQPPLNPGNSGSGRDVNPLPSEDEPFSEDSRSRPGRGESPRIPDEEPFPTPEFGDRDVPPARDVPSRRDEPRSVPGSDSEPFEMDESKDGDRPLPAADDLPFPEPDRPDPYRPDRNRPERDLPGRDDALPRTTSEVMRPQLTIRKDAPKTATVGVSHDYTIVVANEGQTPAYDVLVEDELGGAAEFVDSRPVAEYNRSTGKLEWNIAQLDAGEQQEIRVRIKPTGEGTLDGIATVRFKAQVKSATVITAPKLELDVTGPTEVKVGDEVPLTFTIRNRGTGDASNVILRSVLPVSLKHPEGGDLEYEIELLRAGDSETVDLTVVAAEPGDRILVSAEVTAAGMAAAKARAEVGIVGAQLSLTRLGPEKRYVGRSATYQNIVTNESRFEAVNATVVEVVPEGMRFVSASHGGEYDPDHRRIRWVIPRLAPGKQALLEVELTAEESGQLETQVEVTEEAGFRTPLTENTVVVVEDLHNVTADISRQDAPVAIGERFGFTITIDNRGTAVARNVEMSIRVPTEIRVLAAGTRQVRGNLVADNTVKYSIVTEIQPGKSMTYQVTLQGEKPVRNAHVEAYLTYDEMPEPLIVSESVTVIDDRP